MQLNDQDIAEFQEAYRKAFDENVAAPEAREMASRVLQLYDVLSAPLPDESAPPLDVRPISR